MKPKGTPKKPTAKNDDYKIAVPPRRTADERLRDQKFIFDLWLKGRKLMDIADELDLEYERRGEQKPGYTYVTIFKDLKSLTDEYRKAISEEKISDIEESILKLNHLYEESLISHRMTPNPGYVSAATKVIDTINKLKGLYVDKKEIKVSGSITTSDIDKEIEKLKNIDE